MTDKQLTQLALVGVGALLLFPQLVGWIAGRAGGAAGRAVVDAASGVVIGVGEAVGIPATDADKCAAAIAAGNHWDASFYCPAGTFLADAAGDVWDAVTLTRVGTTEPTGEPEIIRIDTETRPLRIEDVPYPGGA